MDNTNNNKLPYKVKIKLGFDYSSGIIGFNKKDSDCIKWICKRYYEKLGDSYINSRRQSHWVRRHININESIFMFDDKNIATEFLLIYG